MKNKIGIITRIGLWLGGYTIDSCKKCSLNEIKERSRQGYTFLIPFTVGCFSYSYCYYFYLEDLYTAVAIGVLMAIIVVAIDRAIISLTDLTKVTFTALLRIMLTVILAIIMAEPITVAIFKDSIEEEQFVSLHEQKKEIAQPYEVKIDRLESKLNDFRYDVRDKRDELGDEIDGSGGSLQIGDGPVAANKREALKLAQEEFDNARDRIVPQIEKLKEDKRIAVSALEGSFADGMLGSINTLHKIADKEPVVFIGLWSIRFALVIIELLPILLKVSPRKNPGILEEVYAFENEAARDILASTSSLESDKQIIELQNLLNLEINQLKIQQINTLYDGQLERIKVLLDKIIKAMEEEDAQEQRIENSTLSDVNKQKILSKIKELFRDFGIDYEALFKFN